MSEEVRPWPQAYEAEKSLLGGLIQRPEALPDVCNLLTGDEFHRPEHRNLFKLMVAMFRAGEPIDLITIPERTARGGNPQRYGGIAYVMELADNVPSSANLVHYAQIVKRKNAHREILKGLETMRERVFVDDEPKEIVTGAIQGLMAATIEQSESKDKTIQESMRDFVAESRDRVARGKSVLISLGLEAFDQFGAAEEGTLGVLAARPSMGKTALGLCLCMHGALNDVSTGFIGIEMTERMTTSRKLSVYTGLPLSLTKKPERWTDKVWNLCDKAVDEVGGMPMRSWVPNGASLLEIKSKILAWKQRDPELKFVVIDYLSKISHRGIDARTKEDAIGIICQELKELAVKLELNILLLHAVNRQGSDRANPVPEVAHLSGSGQIEYEADYVMMIHRQHYYDKKADENLAELHMKKNRNGRTGDMKLHVFLGQQLFTDPYQPFKEPRGIIDSTMLTMAWQDAKKKSAGSESGRMF